jgi:predicted nucleic acid-binding protein
MVEFLLRTPRAETLESVMADTAADVHVPALCDVEVASALRRLWMSKDLSERRRNEALSDYADLPLSRHGHLSLLPRVLELGANFSAYDGVYVALAEALGAVLVTADERLRRAVETHTGVRRA